jgi:hypothetical protein
MLHMSAGWGCKQLYTGLYKQVHPVYMTKGT